MDRAALIGVEGVLQGTDLEAVREVVLHVVQLLRAPPDISGIKALCDESAGGGLRDGRAREAVQWLAQAHYRCSAPVDSGTDGGLVRAQRHVERHLVMLRTHGSFLGDNR